MKVCKRKKMKTDIKCIHVIVTMYVLSWQLTVKKTLYICLVHLIHWFDLLICKKIKKDNAHCYNCQKYYIYVWFSLFIDLICQSAEKRKKDDAHCNIFYLLILHM